MSAHMEDVVVGPGSRAELDGKEERWININKAIDTKLCAKSYAKSRVIKVKLYVECYAKIASMWIETLRMHHVILYESDRHGNYYHTVEDEAVEVLT